MVSKLKKVFGGIFAVLVVLALIGACFGEDETAGGVAAESAASSLESKYESQRNDFIHKSRDKSALTRECGAGDNFACNKLKLVEKLIVKCKANDDGSACAELALMESKSQVRFTDGNNPDGFQMIDRSSFAKKACELDNVDGCSIGLQMSKDSFEGVKYFGEKACVKFGNVNDCLNAAEKAGKIGSSGHTAVAATNFLVKACELKSNEGCFTLGMLYEGKKPSYWSSYNHFSANYKTAKDYYDKACKLGGELGEKGCESAARLKKERGL